MSDVADRLAAWMAARRYRPRTITESVRVVAHLERLRERGHAHVPPGVVAWVQPTIRRLAAAAATTSDAQLAALHAYAETLLPPPDTHARFRGVAARRRNRSRPTRSLDDAAWDALVTRLHDAGTPAERVLLVMAATGLRVGDVLRITRGAALAARRDGQIQLELKGGRTWTIALDGAPEAWDALLDPFLRSRMPDVAHYVAPGLRADPQAVGASGAYQAVRRTLRRICNELSITEDVWTHRIRRSVGVRAYRETTDVLAVRDLLGHVSPRTTLVYLDEARLERAADLQRKLAPARQ